MLVPLHKPVYLRINLECYEQRLIWHNNNTFNIIQYTKRNPLQQFLLYICMAFP